MSHTLTRDALAAKALLIAFSLAACAAGADIPSGPEVRTQAQFDQKELAFNLKTSLDAYKASGSHDPKWDASAPSFIERCERSVFVNTDRTDLLDLQRIGRTIYLDGCDDPLIMYECARVADMLENKEEQEHFARPAAERMAKAGYPANRQAFSALRAIRACKAMGHDDDAKKYADLLVKAVPAIFRDGTYGQDRALLAQAIEELVAELPAERVGAIWMSVKDIPSADPVAVKLIEGRFHIAAAWDQRGGGLANTVAAKGWKGFEEELQSARDCLTKAWELDKTLPEAPTAMISVAMGSAPNELRTWFDRAVAAQADYYQAYAAYIYALYPRWHGDRDALLSFGQECFATQRFDTTIPSRFLDVLFVVREECDHGDASDWSTPAIYDKARQVFEKSLAPGGAYAGPDYLRSEQAAFDVQANAWGDAAKAISLLKHGLDPKATAQVHLTPDEVSAATVAYTGAGGDDAVKAFVLAARGERADAVKAYQAAIGQQKGPAAGRYLRGVSRAIQWESDFYAFKEVKLSADAGLAGFRPVLGRWAADSDGGLIATAGPEQQLYLYCNADFGDNWELHADVDFLRTKADWSIAGLTLCPVGTNQYLCLALSPKQHELVVRIANAQDLDHSAAPIARRNRGAILRRDGETLTFKLGDKEIYQGKCEDSETNRMRIGFGGWPINEDDIVCFRNVSIRRTR